MKTCVVCAWCGDWPTCPICDEAAWLIDSEESPELAGDFGLARPSSEHAKALLDSEAA